MIHQIANAASFCKNLGFFTSRQLVAKALIKDDLGKTQFFTETCTDYSRRVLKKMNIKVNLVGYDAELMRQKNFLIVGNHLSYTDIMIMSSVMPLVFITSVDMGETGFLGTLAQLGGAIFVERRNRSQVDRDLSTITQALKAGFQVALFPEGTSGNGEAVLPFKKSLLMAAPQAGRDIMPVCIRYREINGEPFSEANRDKVCWYGKMDFLPHFLGFLGLKSLTVDLNFLDVIQVRPDSDRQELAAKSYAAISDCYNSYNSKH